MALSFTYEAEKKSFLTRIGRGFRFFFCCVGVFFFTLFCVELYWLFKQKADLTFEPNTALRLSFDTDLYETRPEDLMGALTFGNPPTVADVVLGIGQAAKDPKITALIGYLPKTDLSLAQIQEIRAAIADFRKAGKKTIVYAPSFGELGGGLGAYYLASAFEEIRLQPTGEVGVAGMALEAPYFKNALEKIGIRPSFEARHEYKTGADSLAASQMSNAERENLTALMDSFLTQAASDIGEIRGIAPDEMRNILINGPYFSEQALALKLVDKTEYADVLEDEVRNNYGELADFFDYAFASSPKISAKTNVFALVPAVGVIQDGESSFGGGSYRSILGTVSFSENLRAAADDDTVKAIIVRLDSPGGGYVASDTMWREINYVKESKKKPIVCSIASVAASGGYFLSLGCDKVFAPPAAVTGSIGVFGGKLVFKELLEKLNISVASLSIGKNAGLSSAAEDFTPAQRKFFNESLDRVYADFTGKVAQRRGFTTEKTDKLARGRVFTGAQAVENGLIDGIGGLNEALFSAAELSGEKHPLPLLEYPLQPSRLEMLMRFLTADKLKIKGVVPAFKAFSARDFRIFFNGFTIKK